LLFQTAPFQREGGRGRHPLPRRARAPRARRTAATRDRPNRSGTQRRAIGRCLVCIFSGGAPRGGAGGGVDSTRRGGGLLSDGPPRRLRRGAARGRGRAWRPGTQTSSSTGQRGGGCPPRPCQGLPPHVRARVDPRRGRVAAWRTPLPPCRRWWWRRDRRPRRWQRRGGGRAPPSARVPAVAVARRRRRCRADRAPPPAGRAGSVRPTATGAMVSGKSRRTFGGAGGGPGGGVSPEREGGEGGRWSRGVSGAHAAAAEPCGGARRRASGPLCSRGRCVLTPLRAAGSACPAPACLTPLSPPSSRVPPPSPPSPTQCGRLCTGTTPCGLAPGSPPASPSFT